MVLAIEKLPKRLPYAARRTALPTSLLAIHSI
jgi:hypothetical protein